MLEIGNALARGFKREAVEVIEDFLTSEDVEVVRLTPALFARAFDLYNYLDPIDPRYPFTIILRATASAPQPVVGSDGRIGLRVPNHAIPRLLAKSFGPITSTSANVHGKPSPTTCDEARDQLADRVDVYVDGGPTPLGGESTVVDLSGPRPKIVRQGVLPTGA